MRLIHLSVQHFQCIESAEVDFDAGLNVLYGPNDVGKSSLAWAIRAVLLLQHNSSVHERFVSWYGAGEPRVALTLCDDDDQIWRVTKTFSRTAGRSSLEASQDGRTFTAEASAREVDDKLRTMFGWGVQAPGGKGPKGLPESFLTQVLLAEQDSVRKVLFDTSLADDPDEAGRLRLVEALGALAQDPLFKQILDETQESVDRAFTPKGRKKTSKGSPYLEIADRLKQRQRDHDELSVKVRETEAAEAKIRELSAERDQLQRDLEEENEELATTRRRFAAWQRRDDLAAQRERHQATVDGVDDQQRAVARAEAEIVRLTAAVETASTALDEATTAVAQDEAARDHARRHLDGLTHDDVEHARQTAELEAQARAAAERRQDADHAVEGAQAAERQARASANEVASAAVAADDNARLAKIAEDEAVSALTEVTRAQRDHTTATQRVQDASSDARARARELEQKDLENRRLTRAAERGAIELELQRAAETGKFVAEADTARAAQLALAAEVAWAQEALATEEAARASDDAASALLRQVEGFGALSQVRAAVAATTAAAASCTSARAAADALRTEAAALQATVRANLPTTEVIAGLRELREQRRTADARLGGGLSVTVRPKRPLAITATADGVAVAAASTGAPVVLTANQVLVLGLGDVVDLEVTAGEEGARTAAAALRERWSREGAPTLAEQDVDTVEQLEALRRDADATMHAADQRLRDAALHDERAQVPVTGDLAALTARAAELETELGDADRAELGARFARLGDSWQTAVKRQLHDLDAKRTAHGPALDLRRGSLTRLQTLLDAQAAKADALAHDASQRQAELPAPWSVLAARHAAALAEAEADLDALARQAAERSGGASDDQQAAAQQLASAKADLALATQRHDECRAASQRARDAVVGATTTLDGARRRAGETLPVAHWVEAVAAAMEVREQRNAAQKTADQRLAALGAERAALIAGARTTAAGADQRAVSTRARRETLQAEHQALAADRSEAQVTAAEAKVQLAQANVEEARRALATLPAQLAGLAAELGPGRVDGDDVAHHERSVQRKAAHLREAQDDLAKASGGLEQVGGTIVRERLRELDQAIEDDRARERQIELEYEAWKLLLETLRASESSEGAHLGRNLAGPVSARFRELTGGRYGSLELGPHLEASGLQVAGELREITALSAGTQDQLATLLRLCIAEQLHSAIVLDDHLSQSDPGRVTWFNSVLRSAAAQVQIILITCRPAELLSADELPRPGEVSWSGAAGLIRSVDLTRVIRRAPSPG